MPTAFAPLRKLCRKPLLRAASVLAASGVIGLAFFSSTGGFMARPDGPTPDANTRGDYSLIASFGSSLVGSPQLSAVAWKRGGRWFGATRTPQVKPTASRSPSASTGTPTSTTVPPTSTPVPPAPSPTPLAITPTVTPTLLPTPTPTEVSPLIFGTNLTLMDANDQFLTSSATRQQLKNIHVTLIRMPIRGVGCASTWEVQAAQYIHDLGMVPMVILKFTQADPAGAASCVIQQLNPIFGSDVVYYEFGNERDLAGVNQTVYTDTWNQVIPRIESLATNGKFGGPVNFQYNPTYISYFVHNANPKPDFISWHEYTCGNSATAQYCIDHIQNWATHIASIQTAIQNYGDVVPPMFITEWNYDPNNLSPDSRVTSDFQQAFTQNALQELADDGITGATHYVATGHTEYNLVDSSGSLTPEGHMFGQMYDSFIVPR